MAAEKDIEDFSNALKKIVNESVDRKVLQLIGKSIIETIRRRTRQGFGVKKEGGRKERLKPLSPLYIKQRKRSRLDSTTSARKSNLTLTGAMLRSLRVKSVSKGSLIIGGSNRRRKGGVTNADVVGFVSKDRPFLNLSKGELSNLVRFWDDLIQDDIDQDLT